MPQAHLASGFAAGLGLVCDIEAKPSRPMVMTESNMWDCVQAHEVSALGEALREMEREGGWMCGGVGECVRTKQRSSSALKLLQAVKHTSCVSCNKFSHFRQKRNNCCTRSWINPSKTFQSCFSRASCVVPRELMCHAWLVHAQRYHDLGRIGHALLTVYGGRRFCI